MQWTEEQARAIDARGTNILLSAAAGSGKTTVLVERVLRLIREGFSVDRMLIVTFTRAASADMRAKLSRELGTRAAQGDERCRSQQLLLERASISTLHGFCSDFLRAHFESAGIDPAFRVLDDAEVRRLSDEALDAALEEAYAAGGSISSDDDDADPADEGEQGPPRSLAYRGAAWADALSALDYARGPKGVRELTGLLLKYLDERPDPTAWLERACAPDADMRKAWFDELSASARACIANALIYTRMALDHPECNSNYAPALEKDLAELERIAALTDFAELARALGEFRQTRPGAKRSEPKIGPEVTELRESAMDALKRFVLRDVDLGVALSDAKALEPQLGVLRDIALRARELFDTRKAELSGLSYTDLEHRTLRALQDDAVAAELRERFDHIFVDEYQDTSDVQEALISRIARGDNLFMVGDVKQSIYRFRQAEPRLFLDKYARYGRGEGGLLLPLTMNFRSRPAILDFVNRVFECSMIGGDSEIVYDELARLNHGNRSLTGGQVEVHLLNEPDKTGDDEALIEMATCEREALFIAARIRALMAEDPSLHYRDFAILTRAKRGVLGRMATVLLQEGIPAFADGSEAFYDSVEVLLALSLLKLTANRRSDVELIGVLRSPVVGLTLNDLARIRAAFPKLPFADAVAGWADGTDELAWKLRDFLLMLERWRLQSLCTDLGTLTRRILEESGLYDCMGALPGGAQRQANLDHLADNAVQFDLNISGSLTRFLKHTEKLQARGDGDEAHLLGEGDDVVRLMTAHKSKGLEFPIVFGAMMGRRFRGRPSATTLSAHRDLGMGCLYCDPNLQTRRRTLPQMAIAECEKRQDKAEELRILYVLLTRARDRLILVGSTRDPEAEASRWNALRETPGVANSYLDVVMLAIGMNGGGLCQLSIHTTKELAERGDTADANVSPEAADTEPSPPDPKLIQALLWRYPDPDTSHRPLKLTVTGLLREIQSPDALEPLIERPTFLTEDTGRMSGAERGTAYHRAMQLLDLASLRGLAGSPLREAIRDQLDRLAAAARLNAAQRAAVDVSSIALFLECPLGQRLLLAREVRREWAFNARMNVAAALSPEEAGGFSDGEILVQGSIDCCFREDGHWVLLDYKTDRSGDGPALTLRYRNQLRLYAEALCNITQLPVAEIWLCLLRNGETMPIPTRANDDSSAPL